MTSSAVPGRRRLLQPAGQASYQGPRGGPGAGAGRRSGAAGAGKGVLDVDGPSGSGGGQEIGRKTILNYGQRRWRRWRRSLEPAAPRIVEPAADSDIVAEAATAQPAQQVAEVKLDGKGVNMTISGQIQGRKILKSVAAGLYRRGPKARAGKVSWRCTSPSWPTAG